MAGLAEQIPVLIFNLVHFVGDVMRDVGLHFPHHATVYEHLVWPENAGAIQFAAMKQDVFKRSG